MLRSLLLHVRSQSKTVRNQYALGLAGIFTGVVALFWFFNQTAVVLDPAAETATAMSDTTQRTPFSTLLEQSKKQLAALGESLKEQIGTSTKEATVPADALILTDETISEVTEERVPYVPDTASGFVGNHASYTVASSTVYKEVLIATTSSAKPEIAQ